MTTRFVVYLLLYVLSFFHLSIAQESALKGVDFSAISNLKEADLEEVLQTISSQKIAPKNALLDLNLKIMKQIPHEWVAVNPQELTSKSWDKIKDKYLFYYSPEILNALPLEAKMEWILERLITARLHEQPENALSLKQVLLLYQMALKENPEKIHAELVLVDFYENFFPGIDYKVWNNFVVYRLAPHRYWNVLWDHKTQYLNFLSGQFLHLDQEGLEVTRFLNPQEYTYKDKTFLSPIRVSTQDISQVISGTVEASEVSSVFSPIDKTVWAKKESESEQWIYEFHSNLVHLELPALTVYVKHSPLSKTPWTELSVNQQASLIHLTLPIDGFERSSMWIRMPNAAYLHELPCSEVIIKNGLLDFCHMRRGGAFRIGPVTFLSKTAAQLHFTSTGMIDYYTGELEARTLNSSEVVAGYFQFHKMKKSFSALQIPFTSKSPLVGNQAKRNFGLLEVKVSGLYR
jgi:hypothetical protein